jgi:tRNA nucleotidyltransferase/poly(A) polymerase
MDPDVHVLKVVTYGADPEDIFSETAYNVFITSYSEDLVRRDLTSDVYFWKCDLELEEV